MTETETTERNFVDYDKLFNELFGPGKIVSFQDIKDFTGFTSDSSVAQVITTLSFNYPIWKPARGKYKIVEKSDYQNYWNSKDEDDEEEILLNK